MSKSYYAILGITAGASGEEIRAAYRRLAKEFHPDYYTGGSDIFRQIQEAYSVLSREGRRRQYDEDLKEVRSRPSMQSIRRAKPEPLIPEDKPTDLGEISLTRSFHSFTPSLDEIFDWLWSNFSSVSQPKSGRIQNLTVEINLSDEQVIYGGNARVMVPVRSTCPTCRGYGHIGFYECFRCGGEGAIVGEIPISVSFPPGLAEDRAVVIPLERFGISNVHLTVLFRLSGRQDLVRK